MSGSFDGYHVWLGIPSSEQPPNHYRLLGIALFEADLDVIDHAADRQMAHVRTFQAGKNGAASQQILNELSVARISLLNPSKKAAYDEQLRAKLHAVPKAVPVSPATALPRATPIDTSLLKAQPVAKSPSLSNVRASASAAPIDEQADELADELHRLDELDSMNKDSFGLPAGRLATSGTIQVRSRRRRLFRAPSWATSAGLGISAGIIVVVVLMLYYFGRQWMQPGEWQQFILGGPSASTNTELPAPTEAETGATPPPPPTQ